jgi:hypothetical protein
LGTIEEEIGCAFGLYIIREPGVEGAKMPLVEVMVKANFYSQRRKIKDKPGVYLPIASTSPSSS